MEHGSAAGGGCTTRGEGILPLLLPSAGRWQQGRDALATLRRAAPATLHDPRNRHEPRNPNRVTVVTKRGCAGTQRSPQIPMSAKIRSDRLPSQPPTRDAQAEGTQQRRTGHGDSRDCYVVYLSRVPG